MKRLFTRLSVAIATGVLGVAACDSSESNAPHGHDPVAAKLFVNGTEITPTIALAGGQSLRMEVRLYDDEGNRITGLETDHQTAVSFTPASLASVQAVAGQPFQWDVTADSAGGTGTASVGYGHDAPDERVFGPFTVNAAAAQVPVTITFVPVVGAQPFACGQTYAGVGTTAASVTPTDFRLYVHDVRLVRADNSEEPVTLEQDGLWQYQNVALLDFEDGTGGCGNGTAQTHTALTGTAAYGAYTGIRYRLGLPFALNHGDPTTAPSPLNVTALFWSWNSGYKFLRLDHTVDPAGTPSTHLLHLGSTGCNGATATTPPTACTEENIAEIALTGFDPRSGHIVADVAAVLATSDLSVDAGGPPGCMSGTTDPECGALFAKLGLPFGAAPAPVQSFFTGQP